MPIELARQVIKQEFLKFASLVIGSVMLPEGHGFANHPAWELEHQLNWNLGCAVRSSEGGLSLHAGLNIANDSDSAQKRIEVRYFHPSMQISKENGTTFIARRYNEERYTATIWVDEGRPFSGMTRSLIGSDRFAKASTIEDLASAVISKLSAALNGC